MHAVDRLLVVLSLALGLGGCCYPPPRDCDAARPDAAVVCAALERAEPCDPESDVDCIRVGCVVEESCETSRVVLASQQSLAEARAACVAEASCGFAHVLEVDLGPNDPPDSRCFDLGEIDLEFSCKNNRSWTCE